MVNLDLRHLGEAKLRERLPPSTSSPKVTGIDPAHESTYRSPGCITPWAVCAPTAEAATLPGLYAVGECASVGVHGANRLGSNSLIEMIVFGKMAGDEAASFAKSVQISNGRIRKQAEAAEARALGMVNKTGGKEKQLRFWRTEMGKSMEDGGGIYRTGPNMQATCDKIDELRGRYKNLKVEDKSKRLEQ